MARRKKGLDIHGILLLDKPAGLSSNQALQKARHLLNARKAGHTGSLDPFATGMLPICFGEASKTAAFMIEAAKGYRATAVVGIATSTGDIEGEQVQTLPFPDLTAEQITTVLSGFKGSQTQIPPMYSALKHQGQPLYRLARQGITVERKAREITIHHINLLSWKPPQLIFEVNCSKGSYIRTLAEDICSSMGSCGHLRALRRLWVDPFNSGAMVSLEQLEQAVEEGRGEELLLPMDAGITHWPAVTLESDELKRFGHGNAVLTKGRPGWVRVISAGQQIVGLGVIDEGGMLQPKRVFVLN